jgi:hypothetical protein
VVEKEKKATTGSKETLFLALDKCLPRGGFLEVSVFIPL